MATGPRHNHWLRRAVGLVKSRSGGVKNASCDLENPDCVCTCIVISPNSGRLSDPTEAQPLAEAVSTDAESCIDHATMLAVNQVGRYGLRSDDTELSSQYWCCSWHYDHL